MAPLPSALDSRSFRFPAPYDKLVWLSDQARSMGIHIQAGKGSGKSRLMGRIIAWLDFLRGVPLVIFDPHGQTIDNLLDKLMRLPRRVQERLWRRVLYVDMSGQSGHVVPFPLYYRLGGESLYTISQRYLDVLRRLDPFLQTASVEGWNPLWRTGTYAGMILAALGYQITEAEDLLADPEAWVRRYETLLSTRQELLPAIAYFSGLAELNHGQRLRRTESFANKIAMFTLDPGMRAMFGAGIPGIDWRRVVEHRQAVLLDFRHEHDIERRRFKMMWAFHSLLEFIKHRGAGRHRPLSVVIDELAALSSLQALAGELFASDIDELVNLIARNYMIWLTIAHQELFQFSERLQKTLMSMGTQMIGVTSDPEAAEFLARSFFAYDPDRVRKQEPVYTSFMGMERIIDWRSVEFTNEEQRILHSYDFTNLGRFEFLVRPAPGEGETRARLRKVSISRFDQGLYPDGHAVSEARGLLAQRCGRPIDEVRRELTARSPRGRGRQPRGAAHDEIPAYEVVGDEG